MALCFQKSYIANTRSHFESSLQLSSENLSVAVDQNLEKNSFILFRSHSTLRSLAKIACTFKCSLMLAGDIAKKSNALFSDKI